MKRFPIENKSFLQHLLFAGGAGLELAGESGSGKSESMLSILANALASVHFAMLIDPDNDTAIKARNICLANPKLAKRMVYFQFNDPKFCGSFDPLSIATSGDPLIDEARRVFNVEHLIHITLAAWGETTLDSRPVLSKNLYRILHTCSSYGLPFSEARKFFDLQSPIYPILASGVVDPVDRQEMLELPNMRPADRDAQIGSAMNRINGVLRNPLMQFILSKTRASGAFDFEEAYRQGLILIFNVHRGTTLRTVDQQLLANMILASAVNVVMTRPLNERKDSIIGVEELPVFRSSEDLLKNTITRIRKYQSRFLFCHQGAHTFEGGLESPFLGLIRGNCKAHLYFRSTVHDDATFTSKQVTLPTVDLKKVKFEHWEEEQYQDGNEVVTLLDQSESNSIADQQGGGDAVADSTSTTNTNSLADHADANTALKTAIVNAQSQAVSGGTTRTANNTWSSTNTSTKGVTHKQTLVPVMKWRKVLRMMQFWTTEELYLDVASKIAAQKPGQAILYFNGLGAQQFQFPLLPEPFAKTPKFAAKKILANKQMLLERPEFDTVENIKAFRARFMEQLLIELQKVALPAEKLGQLSLPIGASLTNPRNSLTTVIDPSGVEEESHGPWSL